jgi:hypothetical protein
MFLNFALILSILVLLLRQIQESGRKQDAREQGDNGIDLESVAITILSALLLIGCITQAAWHGLDQAGYLESMSDADSDIGEDKLQAELAAEVSALESGTLGSKHESKRGPKAPMSAGNSPASTSFGTPGSKGTADTSFTASTRASHDL